MAWSKFLSLSRTIKLGKLPVATLLVCFLFATNTDQADSVSTEIESSDEAPRRETRPPISPTAEEVAKQLLEIQQQLGGSIVDQSPRLSEWSGAPPSIGQSASLPSLAWDTFWGPPATAGEHPPVAALRASAWQLDTAAHRLESHDLYRQADALRKMAEQLRGDARVLKQDIATPPQ